MGVGALAGPVMAAAVVLRSDHKWLGELDDSKRLGWRKREELHGKILEEATAVGMGYASNTEIDKSGVFAARGHAMVKAYQEVERKLGPAATAAVVDGANLRGRRNDLGGEHSAFVDKADQRSLSVAAASIVAKVTRDRYMRLESKTWSGWGFNRNVGYGTPEHLEALERHGASSLHRKTFAPVKEALEKVHR